MSAFIKAGEFISVFNDVNSLSFLTEEKLSELFIFLRAANLLGVFAYKVEGKAFISLLPEKFQCHITSNINYYERQSFQVGLEIFRIDKLLREVGIKPIFLKGAAYNIEKLRAVKGRTMSDIDILVSSEQIKATEQRLRSVGWQTKEITDYDDKYYREFAHEIPPMFDPISGTTLDVHHNLYLPISGKAPDEELVRKNIVTSKDGIIVLAKHMQALHSCVHLFWNEDVSSSLRDLFDFHCICSENSTECFWQKIVHTAEEMHLTKLLLDVLGLAECFFGLSYPSDVRAQLEDLNKGWFLNFRRQVILFFMQRALIPNSRVCNSKLLSISRRFAYIRGHLLKMPLIVLIPHMIKKVWFNITRT